MKLRIADVHISKREEIFVIESRQYLTRNGIIVETSRSLGFVISVIVSTFPSSYNRGKTCSTYFAEALPTTTNEVAQFFSCNVGAGIDEPEPAGMCWL
jgi:hypothetical protein